MSGIQKFDATPVRPSTPAERHAAALAVVSTAADQGWMDEARGVLEAPGLGGAA